MKKTYLISLFLVFAFESLLVFSESVGKTNLRSSQPTGGSYTLYKLEEYIYCLLTGFILILSMGTIISLNEQNALITENTMKLAKRDVISVANAQLDSKNDQKLVHMTDEITVKWPIFEDELFFNISEGYKLFRKVEVLQHYELKESSDTKNIYFYYPLIWKSEEIDSDVFNNKEYKNQKYEDWKMHDREFIAKDASIGAFSLFSCTLATIENYKEYNLDEIKFDTSKIAKKFENRFIVTRKDNFLLFAQNKDEETTGDFRINYFLSFNERVSIIGKQIGNTIEPFDYYFENAQLYYAHNLTKQEYLKDLEGKTYTTENKQYVLTPKTLTRVKRKSAYKDLYSFFYGGSGIKLTISPIQSIHRLIIGKFSKDSIIEEILKASPVKVWKVRIWGFIINFLSLCVIATPFREYFEYIPYYGDVKNFAYTVFASSFSIILTIIIVLFSWGKYKPYKAAFIASVLIIIPAVMGVVYVFYYKK